MDFPSGHDASRNREEALRLLAGKEATGSAFFDVAARALTLGLGCRWAGFGRLDPDGMTVSLVACWDGSGEGSEDSVAELFGGMTFDLVGSPCREIYSCRADDPYRMIPDRLTEIYSVSPRVAGLGIVGYRGEALFSSDGARLGHAFAIYDKSVTDDGEETAFFRLVAQRAGAEFNRQIAEEELRKAKERAELASRSKSEFLANASHELRTPLNAVLGFSELLRDETLGPIGDKRYQEYAEHVHTSGQHLLKIISDILDLSKLETGRIALYDDVIDVATTIEAAVGLQRERAIRAHLSLTTELPADLPPIEADSQRLKQMLTHLLSNAIKFTPSGGRVKVLANTLRDGRLQITVRDSGIGIEPENLPKVLETFGQVEGSKSRQHEGLGLGLPLAKHIAELHNGELKLAPNENGGTDAIVTLPPSRSLSGTQVSAAE